MAVVRVKSGGELEMESKSVEDGPARFRHVRVYDSVLDGPEFDKFSSKFCAAPLHPVARRGASTEWDGVSFKGPVLTVDLLSDAHEVLPIDLVARLICAVEELSLNSGAARFLVGSCRMYPAGSRLSWHRDLSKLGSFIYYLHREWKPDWGGELLAYDGELSRDDRLEDSILAGPLMAIPPRPNRLVVIDSGVPHFVSRVDPLTATCRTAFTGFFVSEAQYKDIVS